MASINNGSLNEPIVITSDDLEKLSHIKVFELINNLNLKLQDQEKELKTLRKHMAKKDNELRKEIIIKFEADIKAVEQRMLQKIENQGKRIESVFQDTTNEFDTLKKNVVTKSFEQSMLTNLIKVNCKVTVLKTKLNLIDMKLFNPLNTFIWKIYNFENTRKQDGFIFSENFYSHREGYKMWIIMYPNGTDIYQNTHLCFQFGVVTGEYDTKLAWPFKYALKLGIVNQATLELQELCLECEITKDKNSQYFCFLYKDLENISGFFQDDCLIIQCYLLNSQK